MTGSCFYTVDTLFDFATGRKGWMLARYNVSAGTGSGPKFDELVKFNYLLNYQENVYPLEEMGDPMISEVNDLIGVSSWYMPDSNLFIGHGTHHNFFRRDLTFVGKKILQFPECPRHLEGSSVVFLDGYFYLVTVSWRDYNTNSVGPGVGIPLTPDSGYFWFFNASNIELVVKVLDGRSINGYFWVMYGALSDVEYTHRIRDLKTGAKKTYYNPPRILASRADIRAFPAVAHAQ